MKQTCVIYARQSSGDDEFSESVELQIQKLQELAAKEKLEVKGVFSDLNTSGRTYPRGAEKIAEMDGQYQKWYAGQTKTKKFRDGLGDALAKITAEKINYLLVYDLTRLYRPVTGSFLESYMAQRLDGVKLKTIAGEVDFSKFTDALVSSLTNRINDDQMAKMKKRAIEAVRKIKSEGRRTGGGITPIGYTYDRTKRTLVANAELDIIRTAYRMIITRVETLAATARMVSKARGRWTTTESMKKMLANPIYCGMVRTPDGKLIDLAEGQISETAVTKREWYEAQNAMVARTSPAWKKKLYNYGLSSLIYCGACGHPMGVRAIPKWDGMGHDRKGCGMIQRCDCARREIPDECSKNRMRYSDQAPTPIGEKPDYEVLSPNGLAGHMQSGNAKHGADEPENFKAIGLADAVLPLLALDCLEMMAAGTDETAKEQLAKTKMELAGVDKKRSEYLDLLKSGLATLEEVKAHLTALANAKTALQADLARLEAECGKSTDEQRQRGFAMLEAIQKRNLHPSDQRELFLRRFSKIVVYAERVEIIGKDGLAKVVLPKVTDGKKIGVPDWTLRIDDYKDGRRTATVKYYNRGFFKDVGPEKKLYQDDSMKVVILG